MIRRSPALCLAVLLTGGPVLAQVPPAAPGTNPYVADGEATLQRQLALKPRTGQAKNVILFIGDGMGLSTVNAGRIFEGQSRGPTARPIC